MPLLPLFPLQVRALELLRAALRSGHKRPVIQAPTGFGKTVLSAHIVSGAHAKRNRVAMCVPRLSLVDQTFDRFVQNGINPGDMGVMQASHLHGQGAERPYSDLQHPYNCGSGFPRSLVRHC